MTMPAQPMISIALSMRNAAATIGCAVRSLLLQTCTDWELLLLDDGSSDDGVDRVQRFADARIRLVSDGQRRGLAARLNQAIDLARGRFLARMDADDVAYPERLERQLAFLQANPEVDLLGSGMMVFADDGRPIGLYPVRETHEEICSRPYSGFYLAHPTWMGKTQWFRRWRYDPTCRRAQDQDLLLRSYAHSRFAVLPEPLAGYRQDALSVKKSLVARYFVARAIAREAWRDHAYAAGAAAIALQAAKFSADAFAISSGLSRRLLSHQAVPFTATEASRWRDVWRNCHQSLEPSCAA
ncbi:MAG: glycosyltransferase [Betaproteobacteria bacterium]|nr:MAG: glycosyltransferase [Betaproteobacteria bacterium]